MSAPLHGHDALLGIELFEQNHCAPNELPKRVRSNGNFVIAMRRHDEKVAVAALNGRRLLRKERLHLSWSPSLEYAERFGTLPEISGESNLTWVNPICFLPTAVA